MPVQINYKSHNFLNIPEFTERTKVLNARWSQLMNFCDRVYKSEYESLEALMIEIFGDVKTDYVRFYNYYAANHVSYANGFKALTFGDIKPDKEKSSGDLVKEYFISALGNETYNSLINWDSPYLHTEWLSDYYNANLGTDIRFDFKNKIFNTKDVERIKERLKTLDKKIHNYNYMSAGMFVDKQYMNLEPIEDGFMFSFNKEVITINLKDKLFNYIFKSIHEYFSEDGVCSILNKNTFSGYLLHYGADGQMVQGYLQPDRSSFDGYGLSPKGERLWLAFSFYLMACAHDDAKFMYKNMSTKITDMIEWFNSELLPEIIYSPEQMTSKFIQNHTLILDDTAQTRRLLSGSSNIFSIPEIPNAAGFTLVIPKIIVMERKDELSNFNRDSWIRERQRNGNNDFVALISNYAYYGVRFHSIMNTGNVTNHLPSFFSGERRTKLKDAFSRAMYNMENAFDYIKASQGRQPIDNYHAQNLVFDLGCMAIVPLGKSVRRRNGYHNYNRINGFWSEYGVTPSETKDPNGNPLLYFGTEIETEVMSTKESFLNFVVDTINHNYPWINNWLVPERDGTLALGGIEWVSTPCTPAVSVAMARLFINCAVVKDCLHVHEGCGHHVHINRSYFTPTSFAKFFKFMGGSDKNKAFLEFISERQENQWSRMVPKDDLDGEYIHRYYLATKGMDMLSAKDKMKFDEAYAKVSAKYNAINVRPPHTYECRCFKSQLDERLIKNLQFLYAAVRFATYINRFKLSSGDFINWFLRRKDDERSYLPDTFKELSDWLESKRGELAGADALEATLYDTLLTKKILSPATSSEVAAKSKLKLEEVREAEPKNKKP